MPKIKIRTAMVEDANLITQFIKNMVIEMENYGGYSVNGSPDVWVTMESEIRENITQRKSIYLVAIDSSIKTTVIGVAAGYLEQLEHIFNPTKRLHISAIYTIPHMRRKGVAQKLLEHLLRWGKKMNASEVDLNVLIDNPARLLYEKFGFESHEISMIKKLNTKI